MLRLTGELYRTVLRDTVLDYAGRTWEAGILPLNYARPCRSLGPQPAGVKSTPAAHHRRCPRRTPIPNAHGSVFVVTVLMTVALPMVVLCVMPIPFAMMLERFGPAPPVWMMLCRPIRVVLHPPIAVVPMVGVVIVPIHHPVGMCAIPLGMMLKDPVRIVSMPPVGVTPLIIPVPTAHLLSLRANGGMRLKEAGVSRMTVQVGRIA